VATTRRDPETDEDPQELPDPLAEDPGYQGDDPPVERVEETAADQVARKAAMRASILAVLGSGLGFAVLGAGIFGLRAGLGVLVGAVLATANLWVFSRLGEAFISRHGNAAPWAVIAVLKLLFLFGGVWMILKSGAIPALALAAGYGALPVGITLSSLFGPKPYDDAGDDARAARRRRSTGRPGKGASRRARPRPRM
jgi:hypothetical protein